MPPSTDPVRHLPRPAHIHAAHHLPSPISLSSVQGTLALDLQPRHDPPDLAPAATGRAAAMAGEQVDLRLRRQVEQWCRRYAQAVVEIVGGDRPVSQLLRWTTREVYLDLERRTQLVARAGGHQPGAGRVQPVRPVVLSVHCCFLSRSAVEASIHTRYGARSRAVAARFDLRGGRWQCSALEFA